MSTFLLISFLQPVVRLLLKFVYWIWFGIIRAIASTLDMLTQLFFVFSGMTPVAGNINSNGEAERVDIVNFFLTQTKFVNAYWKLCAIALALIAVFTIGRIIKQDYFDRSGPRSKGPIFRDVLLSFIAFICIIPVFYFLVSVTGAIALEVMKAMGYEGGGVGTMLFNMSWSDGGESFIAVGETVASDRVYNPNDFGWYNKDTYYYFRFSDRTVDAWGASDFKTEYSIDQGEFYWWIFLFGGCIVLVNLLKMMLAMLTRIYKLIALFIIAPSPISQIVLDGGTRFKGWKDKVIQEAVKVIGCVMSFMLYAMIITSVNNLDIMQFVNTEYSASAISLIDSNGLTSELANVSPLYIHGAVKSWEDYALNALGKMLLIIAGAGAVSDIDSTLTPFLYGGSASMDLGEGGKHLATMGADVVKGASALVGGLAGGVTSAIGAESLARKQAMAEAMNNLETSDEEAARNQTNNNQNTDANANSNTSNNGMSNATTAEGTAGNDAGDEIDDAAATTEGDSGNVASETDGVDDDAAAGGDGNQTTSTPNDTGEEADDTAEAAEETAGNNAEEATNNAQEQNSANNENANDSGNSAAAQHPVDAKAAREQRIAMAQEYANKKSSRAFLGALGKGFAVGLGKTAAKAPLNLLGFALKSVGMGNIVTGVKEGFSKSNHYADYKKDANKIPDPTYKGSKADEKHKKEMSNMATEYQNWQLTEGATDNMANNAKKLTDNGAGLDNNNVNAAVQSMTDSSNDLVNAAYVANEYAEKEGVALNPDLTYSGDIGVENDYYSAVNEDRAAGEQLQTSQAEFDAAQNKLQSMNEGDQGFEEAQNDFTNKYNNLNEARQNKLQTEEGLAKATTDRENCAAKNKTKLYKHIKAQEELQRVNAAIQTSKERTNENYEARGKLESAAATASSTSLALQKEINKTSNAASKNTRGSLRVGAKPKPTPTSVRASSVNYGDNSTAYGAYTDMSNEQVAAAIQEDTSNDYSQHFDSGNPEIEAKYAEAKENQNNKKNRANHARLSLEDLRNKLISKGKDPNTNAHYLKELEEKEKRDAELNQANQNLQKITETRDIAIEQAHPGYKEYMNSRNSVTEANNAVQNTKEGTAENAVARIKLRVAQKRLATATNRLTGIPNGDREPISIPTNEQQRNRFQVEVIKMTDEGQIGGNLAEAALSTFGFDASSAEDQRRLSPAVTNIPDMCEMGYDNDSQLQEAINNMDVNAILQSLPDSAKAGGTQGYKDDLQRRYTGATKTYSENVNRAKEAIIAYNNSGKTPGTRNPALLAQVQEAIKAAMGSSAVIRDIKLEIENNTKK